MADTTFVDYSASTPIVAAWLNDVNDVVYTDLGGVGTITTSAGANKIGFSTGTTYTAGTVGSQLKTNTASLAALAATTGAGLVGYDTSLTYSTSTVGKELQKIGTLSLGAQTAGSTSLVTVDKTYSGHSGGTSDIRNWVMKTTFNGSNNAVESAVLSPQAEFQHTSGTLTFGYGIQGFNRLGLSPNTWTGAITSCRGVEWHTANESNGNITTALDFYAQDVDLQNGTGTIGTMIGFLAGNQGHATRVTTAALGYDCGDMTAGATLTAAYRSQMLTGTNKWGFYASGSAKNAFTGNTRIGDTTAPSDVLEVKGYAKLTNSGTITTTGTYHEIVSSNNDYVAHVRNTHASTPEGLRIRFTAASPNNTTQHAILFEDSTTSRFIVWSNGNAVNSNNSYGAISDKRLKENIVPATDSVLDKFRQRQFYTYNLIADEHKLPLRGVIAQEEQKISPELVDASGEHLTYNYAGMAVETGQAVKELVGIVDKLTARIAELELTLKQGNQYGTR